MCPWILALPRREGFSLELMSCLVILDRPQQQREGPGALTHLEENQIGLKGKKEVESQKRPSFYLSKSPSFPFVMIENVK